MQRFPSRRTVLRGAGVALALPCLESLAPRSVRAQAASYPKRLVVVYLPCGAPPALWDPTSAGQGAAWELSPILQPFANLKSRCTVLTGVENYSAYDTVPDNLGQAHGRRPGCFLTCANVVELLSQLPFDQPVSDINGTSADQVIAQHASLVGQTPLNSLQLGLGTTDNSCDGPPCSYSRNISWRAPTEPAWPEIDPGTAFDHIIGANSGYPTLTPEELQRRRVLDHSILDYVQESAETLAPHLSTQDRSRVEEFLQSVRNVEQRIDGVAAGPVCGARERPTLVAEFGISQDVPGGYSKAEHSAIMNDLIVMALQCDTTRIVSHMLEHERSEYWYDVPVEAFVDEPATFGVAGNYHGSAEGNVNNFATITRWNAGQVAALCQRLAEIEDAPGVSVLDNTLVMLASSLSHFEDGADLPVILCGNLGGVFKTDQHVAFPVSPGRPLRDLYFTIMNQGFGLTETDFGNNENNVPISYITEILA
ncbi:MAG TPA: DUF1552 domain-containing protein [Polyangiaceae bacterium]|nr:DUF1552 domain-containing protein [Polyangiaceae bacterium]